MARVGLVLGAGGVVGGAFHGGLLAALAEEVGFDARRAEMIVGTSAGALTAALLRAGLAPTDLVARARGLPLSTEGQRVAARLGTPPAPPSLGPDLLGGDFSRWLAPAEPRALGWAALNPWRVRPGALTAAMLPEGRHPSAPIAGFLEPLFGSDWPLAPLWICALRLRDLRRFAFGRDGAPRARVAEAVAASCAIPAVFQPVEIGGDRYVDGGAYSPTNADVLRESGLDLALVSSPMSSAERVAITPDAPLRALARGVLSNERRVLARRGVRVIIVAPDRDDLAVMGANPMDPSRRRPVAEHVREAMCRRLAHGDLGRRIRAALT